MERLELAITGVEQALRPATPAPAWLPAARRQLPRVEEALGAEQTDAGNHSFTARSRRLARERNRLLLRLRQLAPALADGCLAGDGVDPDPEELRRLLLRLVHDIAHHHQRVNDLVYDGAWRDVGGSE